MGCPRCTDPNQAPAILRKQVQLLAAVFEAKLLKWAPKVAPNWGATDQRMSVLVKARKFAHMTHCSSKQEPETQLQISAKIRLLTSPQTSCTDFAQRKLQR